MPSTTAVVHVAEWSEFFDKYLTDRARSTEQLDAGRTHVYETESGEAHIREAESGVTGETSVGRIDAAIDNTSAQDRRDAMLSMADVKSSAQDRRDAIVPSPLMPHLMYEWLVRRARERWPDRVVEIRPLPRPPDTPWERQSPDGTHYASFATWMCPINCIEPRRCPHTRGERTWSMPEAAIRYIETSQAQGDPLADPVIFHCTHRAYGVGMFDTRDVLAGDAYIAAVGQHGAADVLVGTVSHCHGAFNLLHLGA
jgi:hypothetical protein